MEREIDKGLIDSVINKKLETIFGFSMKRTDNRNDAEDLTQDIIIEVYRSFKKLKRYEGPEALEGWIWAIARHTYYRWLNNRNKNSVIYIEGTIGMSETMGLNSDIEDNCIKEEQLNILRKEISFLSKNYRDILVLFYIEEKSCNQIAQILGLSLSTVKWRLHEAKRIIKERMESMKNYTERSYAPGNLWVNSAGTFNSQYSNYYVYDQVKSLLRQNIVFCCYREPLTIAEISVELGIPRAYIEEDIECLVNEQLLREINPGKYQADFLIITKDIKANIYPLLEQSGGILAKDILNIINSNEDAIRNIKFIGSDKPWEELLWFAVPSFVYNYDLSFFNIDMPIKPHGNKWRLLGFEGLKSEYPWSGCADTSVSFDKAFSQTIYWTNRLTFRAGHLNEKEAMFYCNCIKGKIDITRLNKKEEEMAAQLINRGFLVKSEGLIKLNMISFNEEQYEKYTSLKNNLLSNFDLSNINATYNLIQTELKKNVPNQLQKEIPSCAVMLLGDLVGYIFKYLLDKNILEMPSELDTSTKGMYAVLKNTTI